MICICEIPIVDARSEMLSSYREYFAKMKSAHWADSSLEFMNFRSAFCWRKKKKNIKIRNISKSAVLSILSVFMDARIYSDRDDWSGNSSKTMLPSWQPSASLQWHFHVSWGRLRIFLFPEMLLELSHGCWAGSTCGTWLVGIHGVIPLGNTAVEGSCCPVPGIFLGYSGSFLALTSHPIY